MPSDIHGALCKVERANKHINDLSVLKSQFLGNGNPYAVTPQYYPNHDITIFLMDQFTEPPVELALIAGDAAHNLRSALDLLACELFCRKAQTRKCASNIHFPICKTAELYESESPRKVKGLSRTDILAIDALKPYDGGNWGLWGLHQMDIADKHKILSTPAIAISRMGFRMTPDVVERTFKGFIRFNNKEAIPPQTYWFDNPASRNVATKAGDPVFSIKGTPEDNDNVEFTFDVSLGDPEVFKGRPILETLVQLEDLVKGIVTSFELP